MKIPDKEFVIPYPPTYTHKSSFWCKTTRVWYGEIMDKDDAQLVSESISEKSESFEELVHRYTQPIYNFAYRLTGNVQSAEDITQETFVKVWKNLKKYDPSQSFRAWIFTIARNTSTDLMRKKKSIPFSNLSNDENGAFEDTISDSELLPNELISKMENAKVLEKLLSSLPPDYQTVLLLYYQEGLTFDEIGEVLHKPLNTVKSWHRRALLKLREMISAEEIN